MLTAIDQVANRNHLQLIKAAIPYIQPQNQKMISIYIKIMELQNVFAFYNSSPGCVSACSDTAEPPGILDMLSDMRNFCDDTEQEMLDQWIQIISTMELYSIFAQSSEEGL